MEGEQKNHGSRKTLKESGRTEEATMKGSVSAEAACAADTMSI